MLLIIAFIVGAILLWQGAVYLVKGGTLISRYFKVSTMIVGLTVIAIGTSFPELFVSVLAAAKGTASLALGNVVGSTLLDIAFILGICGLVGGGMEFRPRQVLYEEFAFVLSGPVFVFFLAQDGTLGRADGLLLLATMIIFYLVLIKRARQGVFGRIWEGLTESGSSRKDLARAVALVGLGSLSLMIGAKLFVESSLQVVLVLAVPAFIIGLTVVSVGTTLPEFVTSFSAVLRKQADISIGNILGSAIFNILAILGLVAIIKPFTVAPSIVSFDIPLLMVFSLLLFLALLEYGKLRRRESVILIAMYLVYLGYKLG